MCSRLWVCVCTIICPNGPIFMMFWNCSYMSLRVNWPAGALGQRSNILIHVRLVSGDASYHASACQSALHCHLVSGRWLCRSNPQCLPFLPMRGSVRFPWQRSVCIRSVCNNMRLPSSLLIKGWVLKGSKSSMCSPVPIKMMGLRVAATLKEEFTALKKGTPPLTDRKLKLALRAQSSSSFGVSVQFGDNYWSYVHLVFKSFGLRLTGLTNGRIHHIHNIVWLLWKQVQKATGGWHIIN